MRFSRQRPSGTPTPLDEIAATHGLMVATRTWMERTVADVAFDSFAFGHDVLCNQPDETTAIVALERGIQADGTVLAVGSIKFGDTATPWVAAQSRRMPNFLGLDVANAADSELCVGHRRFDERFQLDIDEDALNIVRAVVTEAVGDWMVEADDEHGPLTVIFDGAESAADDRIGHSSAVFLARVVTDDEAFVATLDLTRELLDGFRAVTTG